MRILSAPPPVVSHGAPLHGVVTFLAHPSIPLPFALALLLVALGLDWHGVGDQWDRDRGAAALALPGLTGLVAGTGWDRAAAGHGSYLAASAGGLCVGAAVVLAVTLLGGKRVAGRINYPLWAAVTTLAIFLPMTSPWVGAVLAWPWQAATPIVAAALLTAWVCAFAAVCGWRPHLAVVRSPAWVEARARSQRGDGGETETETETETGRETVTGQTLRTPGSWDDAPAVITSGAPGHALARARVTGHDWGAWWRRMWVHAAPEIRVSDMPTDLPPASLADQWLARQLRLQASTAPGVVKTEEIVRTARRSFKMSRATAYRRIAEIREDLGTGS